MELIVQSETTQQVLNLPAPEPWIRLHQVAVSASLAAGALAYTMTHISGKAATAAAANSVRIGGSVLAHAGRLLGGDLVGLSIQTGVRTTAYVVETTGESATMIGALLASTVAAVGIGSAFLVGNTLYDIYKRSFLSVPLPDMPFSVIESIEEVEDSSEYIVYQLEDKPGAATDMEAVD